MKKFILICLGFCLSPQLGLAEEKLSNFEIFATMNALCVNGDNEECEILKYTPTMCEKGVDINSCNFAGYALYFGVIGHIAQDANKAVKYWRKSCNANLADDIWAKSSIMDLQAIKLDSCAMLSTAYGTGGGVKLDYTKAANIQNQVCHDKCTTEDCNKVKADACSRLAYKYYNGQGVRVDKIKAKELFGKDCDLGEQNGCNNYRILVEQGY